MDYKVQYAEYDVVLSMSQTVGYAIRALACLEQGSCKTNYVWDIATCSNVPAAYLAKTFRKLAAAGIIVAKRGPNGGTSLARPADKITLLEIAQVIDGDRSTRECLLGMETCSDERACPAHEFWKRMRAQLERELSAKTLADAIKFERRARAKARRVKPVKSCSL